MHIAEGVLSAPILIAGGAACAAGLAVGLKRLPTDRLATVAIFSATFFIASLIHVPVGPSSVHLLLNGLIGLILGWAASNQFFASSISFSSACFCRRFSSSSAASPCSAAIP